MSDLLFNNMLRNMAQRNEWLTIVKTMINEPHFGSMFYDIFFEISPDSRKKFTNLKNQGKVLVGALQIIFNDNKKQTKDLFKKMHKAHIKHNVVLSEFIAMKKALIIVVSVLLHMKNEYAQIDIIKKGIDNRFSELQDVVIDAGNDGTFDSDGSRN